MFWTKVAQFGPPGTPQKSAFFQERGRKRMKEWHQVTFTKEWMNALDDTRILAPTHFQNLVSFPRYGRLKKKCWYKLICNGTYWLLLTGHFGLVFIRPSQWSITAVLHRVLLCLGCLLRCDIRLGENIQSGLGGLNWRIVRAPYGAKKASENQRCMFLFCFVLFMTTGYDPKTLLEIV